MGSASMMRRLNWSLRMMRTSVSSTARACGGADAVVQDGHLTEDLAGAQRGQRDMRPLADGADFHLPALDDIGAVGGLPFEKDRRAGKVRLANQDWISTAGLR